jgi:excisionase family DNA binding protein
MDRDDGVNYEGEILNTAEAAEMLRVSTPTLRRMVKKGAIPFFLIGRQPRYRKSELLKLMEPREV